MLLDKYNDVEAYELSHVGIDKFVVPKIAHISKSKILFFWIGDIENEKICDCVKIIHMLKTALGTDAIANDSRRRSGGGGPFKLSIDA